jgi:hypothetical protein
MPDQPKKPATLTPITAAEAVALLAPWLARSRISVRVENANEVWWWREKGCRLGRHDAEAKVVQKWNLEAQRLTKEGKSMPPAPSPMPDAMSDQGDD